MVTDMPDIMTWTGTTIPIGDFRLTYGSIIMLLLFLPHGLISLRSGMFRRKAKHV